MSVTRHQLARIGEKNLFHELDVHHVQIVGIKRFFGSGRRNESKSHQLAPIGENKIFHELDAHHVQKVAIKRFWVQEAKMSLTAIKSLDGEKKIFHELDVHHVQKVGIKCFWAQEAEMSLTAIRSLESARIKFFMNSTYIMSRKQESNVFGVRRPK